NLTKIFVGNRPPERSAHVTVMGNTLEPGPDTGPGLFIGPDTSDSAAFAVDGGGNNLGSVGQSDGLLQVEHRVSRVAPGVVSYARRASSLHTAVSSLSFAPLDMGSFKSWKLTCENIYPTSADKPAIRLSKDGGATWLTAGSYSTAGTRADGATLTSLTASAQTSIPVSDVAWRSDNSRQQRFEATFGDLSAAGSKMIWFDAFYRENASGNMQWTRGGGWWTADSDAINGVQVVMQSNPGVATFKGTCTLKGE
ncbi:MAG: hypothetical protein N2444_00360, partial [Methylocystis sp.]|nr:hypothetical protein [Methylocystis sp.]